MDRQKIESKVNDILVDKLGVEPDMVKNDAKFEDDLGGDSLDCVELIMEFEHEFGISIKDEDAEKCETVKDMYDMIEELV
jgi:acyl carrier protein